jgi:hypothetical protein
MVMQPSQNRQWRTILVLTVFSAVTGCAFAKYSGGTGVSDNPYQIDGTADLLALATDINDYNKCFILISDIDLDPNLPGGQVFTTAVIARDTDNSNDVFDGSSFTGIFDGAGHRITGLTINTYGAKKGFLGLFGRIATNGVVKNLALENTYIRSGNLSNYIGGLAGQNWETSISNCFSTGVFVAGNQASYLGGLVGDNGGNISNCLSEGSVVGGDGSYYLGGLAGENYNSAISNCYSTAAVTAGNNSSQFGGLVGRNEGSINKCYSTGPVAGGAGAYWFGGLVGLDKGSVIDCYFLLSSGPDNGCGTPLTDTEMKQPDSFPGWDFADEPADDYEHSWRLCNEGLEYPYLAREYPPGDIVCPDGVDTFDLAELCDQWLLRKITADLWPRGGDGTVNFADFAVFARKWIVSYDIDDLREFAEQWLNNSPRRRSADIWPWPDGDNKVNMDDLAVMCDFWLQ